MYSPTYIDELVEKVTRQYRINKPYTTITKEEEIYIVPIQDNKPLKIIFEDTKEK